MPDVSYRVLLYRRGGSLGDRLVLGVVHWDGVELRSAFDEGRVADTALSSDDSAVRGAVRALRAQAAQRADDGSQRELFDRDLRSLFPVMEGVGSSLYWSPVRYAAPTRAQEHFEALCKRHGLSREIRADRDRITAEELRDGLRELGERLRARLGERVRVDQETHGELPLKTALSWKRKDEGWNHAIAVSFDTSAIREMQRNAFLTSGWLVQGMAVDEQAVVVVAMPRAPEAREDALRCKRALQNVRTSGVRIVEARPGKDRFAELEALIEAAA